MRRCPPVVRPPIMEKSAMPELPDAHQEAFARHLAELWPSVEAAPRLHGFPISRHPAWNRWRALAGQGATNWWCTSLEQAQRHYSWTQRESGPSFEVLAAGLRAALEEGDEARARSSCLAIFTWGGVAKKPNDGSRLWVERQFAKAALCRQALAAVALLQPGSNGSLARFDGADLLMNAAMTKVYAAASPASLIIYDGRVGAALGLLARRLLAAQGTFGVPASLAFRWGAAQTRPYDSRNPSQAGYAFQSLYQRSRRAERHPDRGWAELVRGSSTMLLRARELLAGRGIHASLGDFEQALFMLGFNVRYPLYDEPRAANPGFPANCA